MSNSHPPTVVYLHGLASSPESAKAVFFRLRFERLGWRFIAPDLNLPEFRTLTLSRCIEAVSGILDELSGTRAGSPIVLMGSSFGGLCALHAYATLKDAAVAGLVLLAPAFDFTKNKEMNPGDLDRWRQAEDVTICHNGLPLNFKIIEDLSNYDSYAVNVNVPCLVIHGENDETIGVEQSLEFKRLNPQITLELFPDNHSLIPSFERIWSEDNRGPLPKFLEQLTPLP